MEAYQIREAKELEHKGKWREAEQYYLRCCCKEQAQICAFIASAIEEGERFRNYIDNNVEPEPIVADKNDSITWKAWYKTFETACKSYQK
jgi:hypothetical protein